MCGKGSTAGRRPLDGIEATLVVADAPRLVWLPREHHRRRVARRKVLDPAAIEKGDELRAHHRELAGRQPGQVFHRHRCQSRARAVRRYNGWGLAQHVSVLGLKCRKRRVVGACEAQLCASTRQKQVKWRRKEGADSGSRPSPSRGSGRRGHQSPSVKATGPCGAHHPGRGGHRRRQVLRTAGAAVVAESGACVNRPREAERHSQASGASPLHSAGFTRNNKK